MSRPLISVFTVALVARLLFFAAGPAQDASRALMEDSTYYHELATNLTREQAFGVLPAHQSGMQQILDGLRNEVGLAPRAATELVPETFRTPGYPVFIAMASLGMRDMRLVLLLQCVLGAVTAAMLTMIAGRIGFGHGIAIAAGLAWALHPALVTYDNLILTESLFGFCTVAAFLAATSRSRHGLVLAATLLGMATLVRPPLGLVFLPGAIALAWLRVPSKRTLAGVMMLACAPAGLWMFRNAAVGEGLHLSTVGDLSLIFYTAPCAVSESHGEDCDRSYPQRWAELDTRLRTQLRHGDDVITRARANALGDIWSNPVGAARMYVKSVVKLGVSHSLGTSAAVLGRPYRSTGLFSALVLQERERARVPLTSLLLPLTWVAANVALLVLAVIGLCRLAFQRQWALLIAFAPAIAAFVLTVGAVGQERMRLPMMMSILLLGSATFSTPRRLSADPHSLAFSEPASFKSVSSTTTTADTIVPEPRLS